MMKSLLVALLACSTLAVQAQTLTGVKLDPPEIKAGEKTTLTASFDLNEQKAVNCNVRVEFGDGTSANFKLNQAKDVPLVTTHTYAKAGDYNVSVLPRTKLPMLKCTGSDTTAKLKVLPVVAAAPAAAAAPACPEGWKLDKKSVSKKTGAFTCTAKANTPAPAAKTTCPGTLAYFENTKKGQVGCRP